MATIEYRLGDAGVLGFAATNPDGSNMDLTGLGLRMRIRTPDGYLILPATAMTGQEIIVDGVVRTDANIVAVTVADDAITLPPRLYPFAVEMNDGTDWLEMASEQDLFLSVEKF